VEVNAGPAILEQSELYALGHRRPDGPSTSSRGDR
jgi:hypothetical protein